MLLNCHEQKGRNVGSMKKFFEEFKKFALKGSVVDLAVGVVIGGAFGKIVTSLVNDIITPLISLVLSQSKIDLSEAGYRFRETDIILRYGAFIQNIIDFLLISLSIFAVIKMFNGFKRKEEKAVEEKKEEKPSREVELLTEIRDLLRSDDSNKRND